MSVFGILPEKPALVYPYITFANPFIPNCLLFRNEYIVEFSLYFFIDFFIIILVKRSSFNIIGINPSFIFFFMYNILFGLMNVFSFKNS